MPTTRMPGAVLAQAKLCPGSIATTFHAAGGNFGCRTIARLPTTNGPLSIRLMLVIDGVHSCQRTTSLMTSHTRAGGASMSVVMLKFLMVQAFETARPFDNNS